MLLDAVNRMPMGIEVFSYGRNVCGNDLIAVTAYPGCQALHEAER